MSMKAYARKRCCKSCYNALYRSMRKELQMGSNKDEMLLDNPSDEIVIAQQQQRKPSVKDKVFAPTRTYFCSRCNLECSSRYHLRTHERTHTGDRPYGCNVCGRRFNRPYEWKVHVLKHATNGRHKEVARAFEQNLELGMEKVNEDPGVQSERRDPRSRNDTSTSINHHRKMTPTDRFSVRSVSKPSRLISS